MDEVEIVNGRSHDFCRMSCLIAGNCCCRRSSPSLSRLFWGLNLSIAFPIMKVLVTDQNLQQYVNQQIREKDAESRDLFARCKSWTRG
ncbi:MAG: hypothetical protein U0903_06705 [Planctomycetales bacterium]